MFLGINTMSSTYDCTAIKWISIPRFQGINSNQSFRDKSGSGSGTSNGGHRRELRHRKSSNTDQEKNLTDDEIVESCKVKIVLQTFYFSAQLQFSRWHMTPQAVSTGAPAETLQREWWPDRWGHHHGLSPGLCCIVVTSFTPISLLRGQILFSVCLAQFDLFNQWVVTGDSRRPGPWHHVLTPGAWGCLMELY